MDEIYRHHLTVNEEIKRKSTSFENKPIPETVVFTEDSKGCLYVTCEYFLGQKHG
jgi:hypothetical protein